LVPAISLAFLLGSTGVLAIATTALAEPINIVANPGFENGTTSWTLPATASIDTAVADAHSGINSLQLDATAPWQGTWQSFPITAGQSYTFSAWERSTTSGGWITLSSYDASGASLDQGPFLNYPGTGSWTYLSATYVAPPGAVTALLGLQSSATGTFWFDDLSVSVSAAPTPTPTPAPSPSSSPSVAPPSPTPTVAPPSPTPTIAPPSPSPTATPTPTPQELPPLHVNGNQLVDPAGHTVVLHGVDRSGGEFMCVQNAGIFQGPTDADSVRAIKSWRTNAVRLPLNEDCWLGINGVPAAYSGAAYRQAVADYVALLNAYGLYAILDLHWNAPGADLAAGPQPMPDADHAVDFWSQVANAFKNHPGVIFDPYNEPYPDSNQDTVAAWTCWRDGGSCPGVTFATAGMQTLVDAIRGAGAKNVIALEGVQFGNTLTGWLSYRPSDPQNNLVGSWHTYEWAWCVTVACYENNVGALAALVPVIAGEVGEDNCDPTWFDTLLSWLDGKGVSYLAWTWNLWGSNCNTISLISDYAGTPTTYGQLYQRHLASLQDPTPRVMP
jgi:endoglucanase